jgi:putative acetyltransferase
LAGSILLTEKMQIRLATQQDADQVRGVHLSAFPADEGQIVSKLAVDLLSEETTPATVSLVAEVDGVAVGHVAFSPVAIESAVGFRGYILAPLAVRPDYQKRCIGSRLVENGIQRLSAMSASILFVYGDPKYYGRFGFRAGTAESYVPPYALRYPFGWQGIILGAARSGASPARIACVASLSDPALW